MNGQQHHQLEDEPIRIFCSFAREDEKSYAALEKQLTFMKKQHLISTWSTQEIRGGDNTRKETEKALQAADIFVLLISSDYLASDKLYEEQLLPALEKYQQEKIRIIPVLLRPVFGLESSALAEFKLLPKEKYPVSAWRNSTDKAFASVAESIHEIAQELKALRREVATLKDPKTNEAAIPELSASSSTPSHNAQGTQTGQAKFEQGYALIIGISSYKYISGLSEVTLKDALKLHDVIRDANLCAYPNKNVKLLLNEQATADGIRDGLRWLAQVAGAGATALIYFSGHGLKVSSTGSEKFYLLTYESDFADLPQTALSETEFTRLQQNIAAQRLLVCLDCCHAEGMSELKGPGTTFPQEVHPPDERDYTRLAQGTGRVILGASLKDESAEAIRALNNSLFTYYLLEALQGKAHVHNDGLIHVMDVFHHIAQSMKSQSQHAILQANTQDNFPIALYRGGAQMSMNMPGERQKIPTVMDERKLREAITKNYKRAELILLCANIESDLANDDISLPVNLEVIGGEGDLPNQVLSLVGYLKRRGYLKYLVRAVNEDRPGLI